VVISDSSDDELPPPSQMASLEARESEEERRAMAPPALVPRVLQRRKPAGKASSRPSSRGSQAEALGSRPSSSAGHRPGLSRQGEGASSGAPEDMSDRELVDEALAELSDAEKVLREHHEHPGPIGGIYWGVRKGLKALKALGPRFSAVESAENALEENFVLQEELSLLREENSRLAAENEKLARGNDYLRKEKLSRSPESAPSKSVQSGDRPSQPAIPQAMEVEPAGVTGTSPPAADSRIWESLRELTAGLAEVRSELQRLPDLLGKGKGGRTKSAPEPKPTGKGRSRGGGVLPGKPGGSVQPREGGRGGGGKAPAKSGPPPASSSEPTWATVVRRRRKGGAFAPSGPSSGGKGGKQVEAVPPPKPQGVAARKTKSLVAVMRKRLPRTAVVAVRRAIGAPEDVDGLIIQARQAVDVGALDVMGLNVRHGMAGERLVEVPGPEADRKADLLAEEMRRVLGEDAIISRPSRTLDLRISGIESTVTADEVTSAVAGNGGCAPTSVRLGPFVDGRRGMRALWIRVPARSALKLAGMARLQLGWSLAKVEVLRPRPLRCYKCLAAGHTRAKCPVGSADRSQLCFRCGLVGHRARGCTGPDHCPVCASRGLVANHRAGSAACPPVYAGGARGRVLARPTSGAQAPRTPGPVSSGDPREKTSASPPKKRKRRPKGDSPVTGIALGDLPRGSLRDPPGRDGTAPREPRVRLHVAPPGDKVSSGRAGPSGGASVMDVSP
jgi:hypothetical protein